MTEYLTEQEQIQQLKSWVKQYGFTILAGILIALAITYGWRYWQTYQNKILSHASIIYDEMLTYRAQNNAALAGNQAKKLLSQYPKTPYAKMAAFMLAREAVLQKNYAEAATQLSWVLNHSKESPLREIARIRLARVLIAEQKPNEAIDLLKKTDDKTFIGLVDEVRGDAYFASLNLSAARKAYHLALAEIPNAYVTRPILQMKYDNLAG